MQWNNRYKFDFSHPVAVVVDMQNDFCSQDGAYHRNDPQTYQVDAVKEMIPRLQYFLKEIRNKEVPIVFVKTFIDDQGRDAGIYVKARPFILKEGLRRNVWGGEIIDELKPSKDDFIVEKTRYSAFYNTNMEVVLRSLKGETLFFTGVATNVCVESSIRDAFFRDYQCILVEDCCKAWNEESHQAAIRNIIHGFGMVMAAEEVLDELSSYSL
jgi:ureidoacrylate peracid hydrolase